MNNLSIPKISKISYNDSYLAIICDYFNIKLFDKLTNIIKTKITNDSLLEFMKQQKVPPIRDKKSKKLIVDINRRDCKRYTFNSQIVKLFSPILESYFTKYFMDNSSILDIKIDPTHGDILYYENGDFFGKHKDTIPKCPYYPYYGIYPRLGDDDEFSKNWYSERHWNMYSLIICLDTTQDNDNGNTLVWLKDHKLNGFNIFNKTNNNYAISHSFRLKKMNWLLFPASSLHEVTAIDQNKMNIKLKFDVWIRIKDEYDDIDYNKRKIYRCPCSYCKQPLTYRRKVILKALYNINYDIKKEILEYLDFFSLKDRCVYKNLGINLKINNYQNAVNAICSCKRCMNILVDYYDKISEEYDDLSSDSDYGMCNDYDMY